MADANSIIDFGDLAKPATVLIEKISNAVGVLWEPRQIRRIAKAEVEAAKIKAIGNLELTEIQQRGMDRLIYQEARKQKNIEDITGQAVKRLPSHAKPEHLEEDWIAHFFDRCENVSDKEMQSLWSNLLASEATTPGTYSKRTIDLIASMDKKDAELFTALCQFTWDMGEPTLVIFDVAADIYYKQGIEFSSLKHLDSIGLISLEITSGHAIKGFDKEYELFYFDIPILAEFPEEEENEISTGKAIFTKAGQELFSICGAKMNQEFYYYAVERIYKQNVVLTSMSLRNPFN